MDRAKIDVSKSTLLDVTGDCALKDTLTESKDVEEGERNTPTYSYFPSPSAPHCYSHLIFDLTAKGLDLEMPRRSRQ